jgi:glycosyltransferase involved in cell wall biosynthesis
MSFDASIVISSFCRSHLLRLFFTSLILRKSEYKIEVIVVNDGVDDETLKVCQEFTEFFSIKYLFTGQRNKEKCVSCNPCIPLNKGIRLASSDVIILTCPEIFHLNRSVNHILKPLLSDTLAISTPSSIYCDDLGKFTKALLDSNYQIMASASLLLSEHTDFSDMPFFLGIHKKHLIDIGGYDEDFSSGYAGEDNDLMYRLLTFLHLVRTEASVVHLYHGLRCDSKVHLENPAWVHNWNLLQSRKGVIKRNVDKDWGSLKGFDVREL